MPSPRIAQWRGKFHRAFATWRREFRVTRFAAASVVTECPRWATNPPHRRRPSASTHRQRAHPGQQGESCCAGLAILGIIHKVTPACNRRLERPIS